MVIAELRDAKRPGDIREPVEQDFYQRQALVIIGCGLGHPRSEYRCQRMRRFVDPVVVDLYLRETCENHHCTRKRLRIPCEPFQRPEQSSAAGTAEYAGPSGTKEAENCGTARLQVALDDREKFGRRRFSVEGRSRSLASRVRVVRGSLSRSRTTRAASTSVSIPKRALKGPRRERLGVRAFPKCPDGTLEKIPESCREWMRPIAGLRRDQEMDHPRPAPFERRRNTASGHHGSRSEQWRRVGRSSRRPAICPDGPER